VTNGKRSGYVWQFDFRGAPRAANVQVPISPETAPWEQQVQFIRTAEAALRRLTEGALTFGNLGASANLIPSSPEWVTVQSTITRLMEPDRQRKAASRLPSEEDLSTVAQFATLLTRQGETIALALVCGAIVGRAAGVAAPGATAESFAMGISGIGVTFGIAGGERRPVLELLRALAVEALARWSELPQDLQTPPPLELNQVREWEEWIAAKTALATRAVEARLGDAITGAWKNYGFGLKMWAEGLGNTTTFGPRLDMAICAAAGTGPAVLMRADPSQMTLADWGFALRRATANVPVYHKQYAPLTLAAVALDAVGFAAAGASFLERIKATGRALTRRNLEQELQNAGKSPGLRVADPATVRDLAILVLAEPGRPPVWGWLPSKRAGILVLTASDAADLLVHPPALLTLPELRFQHLVLAGVPLSHPPAQEVHDRLSSEASAGQGSFTCWSLDEPDQPVLGVRGLDSGSSLEDVLMQIEQQAAPTVYARTLGTQRQPIAPAFSTWLKLPQRRGEGHLLTDLAPMSIVGLILLGYARKLGNMILLDGDFTYVGATTGPDRNGNPRESILLGLRVAGLGDRQFNGEVVASDGGLVIRGQTAEFPVHHRVINPEQVELSTNRIALARWLRPFHLLLRPRWILTLSAQEVGFGLNLRFGIFSLTLLELRGTLFTEATSAHDPTEQPQRPERQGERAQGLSG
jgi:hypothetical protein